MVRVMASRFRVRTAPSEVDREIALRLEQARREISSAIELARRQERTPRSRRTLRDLNRVLTDLDDVQSITPKFNTDDPDQVSEQTRIQAHRERIRKEREEGRR